MVVKREEGRGNFEPIEAGMHSSVSYGLIDLGLQSNNFTNKEQRKILFLWETDAKGVNSEGKEFNRSLSKEYTLSLHEKASLCKMLESWRGKAFAKEELKGFDLRNVLDKPCFLNVNHVERDDRTFANIKDITPLAKGMPPLKRTNEIIYFNMDEGLDGLDKLPEYIQDRIKKSRTYLAITTGKKLSELKPADEELPF